MTKITSMQQDLAILIANSKLNLQRKAIITFRHNPSRLFQHIKNLTTNSSIPTIIHGSSAITNPVDKATLFNNHFNSTFTRSTYQLPPTSHLPTPSNHLSTIDIDEADVLTALSNLNAFKSQGTDNLSPLILKRCATHLAGPITKIFQTSLNTCTIPAEWKIHKIIPIHKSGDTSNVSNYRPISLLCIISKVLEAIVYLKIIDFIRPKIQSNQFGFQQNRSCLSQLLSSYWEAFSALDEGNYCDLIFLDFSKAFNSVPHNELLQKLWAIGITGPLWHWFQNYLTNRYHYVCIDGESSPLLPVLSGVPQGSILGPMLFRIYINDLPNAISHATSYLFADDTKLLKSISTHNDSLVLQHDIDALVAWSRKWNLPLNQHKSVAMRLTLTSNSS